MSLKDDASAQAAATQLEVLADRMLAIQKRSDALGPAPPAVNDALRTRYEQEFQDTSEAVRQSMEHMDPHYALSLQDALGKITATAGR